MPFEVMLTQLPNLPIKFFINESTDEEQRDIERFDKQMRGLKIPTMLLERLKQEFDNNYKLSK